MRNDSDTPSLTDVPTKTPQASNSTKLNRRRFNQQVGGAIGALSGFHFLPALADKKLEKPTVAGIGIGGKGVADLAGASAAGFDVIALVDVFDTKRFSSNDRRVKRIHESREKYAQASFFEDYREMLSEMGDKVDAVTVSTPDHHHYHASALAMNAGKHVYCQKPLTHGIWEARALREIADKTGVKTQMGNQAHANDHMRRCVELIRAGVIGKVKEIHAWTNRPIWPQGFKTTPKAQTIPEGINWEQWIGPAPWVDYSPLIAPFAWRGWWNYGTGALGDMACHIMDMGYWAMQPSTGNRLSPSNVVAKQQGATDLSPPINSIITWQFDQSPYASKDGFKFHWYDGYVNAKFDRDSWQLKKESEEYNHPGPDVLEGLNFKHYGSVIEGEEGKLFFNRLKKNWVLKTSHHIDEFEWPAPSINRARDENNYKEWMDAITGKIDQSESNFSLAGPMTETILLGVLAQRHPNQKLAWDSKKLQVVGQPQLSSWIKREYRDGWKV